VSKGIVKLFKKGVFLGIGASKHTIVFDEGFWGGTTKTLLLLRNDNGGLVFEVVDLDKPSDEEMARTREALEAFDWVEVSASELVDRKHLGDGGFGVVSRVTCKNSKLAGVVMARKQLRAGGTKAEASAHRFLIKEVRGMATVKHLNIIKLLGVCLEPGETSLLMEFADLGNLRDQLDREPPQEPLPAWRRFNLLFGVASGMRRLHMHQPTPILHHDLKAMNVLIVTTLDGAWIAKIADFGLASGSGLSTSTRTTKSGGGTVTHSGPEVLDGKRFTGAADVYGFGMILFEVMTDDMPFEGTPEATVIVMVMIKKERPPLPEEGAAIASGVFNEQQWGFLAGLIPGGACDGPPPGGCWAHEPEVRPSFRELAHVFREATTLFPQPQLAIGPDGKPDAASEKAVREFAAEQGTFAAVMQQVLEDQLDGVKKTLLHGIYEATIVKTPTCFIISPSKLEHMKNTEAAILVQQTADGKGFELSAEGQKKPHLKQAGELLEQAKVGVRWFDKVCRLGSAVVDGRAGDAVTQAIDALITDQALYFYLVDEVTGEPVVPDLAARSPYPIKITKPRKVLPGLLPMMHVGLKAMEAARGVANIGQAFGLPIPVIPDSWHGAAKGIITTLEQPSSAAAYATLQKQVDTAVECQAEASPKAVRGWAQRQLEQFMEEHDVKSEYAGLQRGHNSDGDAVWSLPAGE
jgi:serine/threonine protein kinase